ncbi:Di-sulfide bridge nucleocytoplasmic transport domain-containing protein [Alternaria rosae]|uniref:Di-sulfide bridge nucleocytoplasmic transport domain-containing protein n=1 Tax=Alternaria rosae TaxID=1187941 RepID=UPI001E8DE01C|nr:Di-sulfide bridge nucleocytoplasmic transport domain-containing protein [Alternaria rosae]KAH6872134.1 Di-sulfide bridge nucleocytoplasmic transport domain-containing protein [Alternaria rosae]
MSRSHRPSTTPMDFEWTNQTGPIDAQSPFLAASQQKKRPHSVLDSPSKNGFATPNRLRDPDNRMTYFSRDPSKPLPSTPASSVPAHIQPSPWSMRTPSHDLDFSSGGETPGTPQVDSDPGTPDTQLASKMGRLGNGDAKGGRRDSWFKRTFMSTPSPTKERDRERDKDVSQKYYSKKAENRIVKRRSERSRSKKRAAVHDDDGEDSDNDQRRPQVPPKEAGPVQQTLAMSVGGFLSWVEAHPNLPSVLSYYLQLTVNMFLGSLFIYIVYSAWAGVMTDVDIESSKHASEVMVEIAGCAIEYNRNRCRPEEVVPAMERACGVWETCMNRDPKKVARATVTAKTFAMIFNSFVEEFSYKSMIFTAIIIFGGFNLSNWAFGLLRSQQQQSHHTQPHQQPNDFVPQTPHRVISNGYDNYTQQQSYQQNWQQLPPYQQQQQQQQHTPYQNHNTPYQGQRHIEAPPLVHAHTMPALTSSSLAQEGMATADGGRTPRKRGLFR